MPSKCSVPGCRGNYGTGPKVKTYRFPRDELMQKRWIAAIRRKDFTPSPYSVGELSSNSPVSESFFKFQSYNYFSRGEKWSELSALVCELHFKESDFETEISAYDPKTGRTLTAPLAFKRLKKGIIPSKIPSAPLNSSNRETPTAKRKRLEKEQLEKAVEKSLKNVSREHSLSEISDKSVADVSSSRISDAAKNGKQTKEVKKKRKLKDPVASNKKVNDATNSNIAHQQSSDSSRKLGSESSSDKNKVSGSSNLEAEVTIKEEPLWEAGYGVSEVASKHTTENSPLESLYISSVRSIANENCAELLSTEEENSNNASDETFDSNFYTKPFSMDEREKAFGNFIACELSDLRENLELYTRTKQCIIKVLTEAHFEQMSCGKKDNFSNIQSNNVVS